MKKINGNIMIDSSYTAKWLITHGAIVKDIAPNKFIDNATIFYFADTEEVENIIAYYWQYMATKFGAKEKELN